MNYKNGIRITLNKKVMQTGSSHFCLYATTVRVFNPVMFAQKVINHHHKTHLNPPLIILRAFIKQYRAPFVRMMSLTALLDMHITGNAFDYVGKLVRDAMNCDVYNKFYSRLYAALHAKYVSADPPPQHIIDYMDERPRTGCWKPYSSTSFGLQPWMINDTMFDDGMFDSSFEKFSEACKCLKQMIKPLREPVTLCRELITPKRRREMDEHKQYVVKREEHNYFVHEYVIRLIKLIKMHAMNYKHYDVLAELLHDLPKSVSNLVLGTIVRYHSLGVVSCKHFWSDEFVCHTTYYFMTMGLFHHTGFESRIVYNSAAKLISVDRLFELDSSLNDECSYASLCPYKIKRPGMNRFLPNEFYILWRKLHEKWLSFNNRASTHEYKWYFVITTFRVACSDSYRSFNPSRKYKPLNEYPLDPKFGWKWIKI